MYVWNALLLLFFTFVFGLYYYCTATFNFFKKRGIPYMKPTILLGNFGPRITGSKSFHEYICDIYNQFKEEKFVGIFEGRQPVLLLRDPDIIKSVAVRGAEHFPDRNVIANQKPRYMSRIILALKGSDWKAVRSAVTPVYSASRLKRLLPLMQACVDQAVQYVTRFANKDIEMKEAMRLFTLETIGACAFGIRCDAFSRTKTNFTMAAETFDYKPLWKRWVMAVVYLFYSSATWVQVHLHRPSAEVLVSMLQAAKAERRLNNSKQSDFLQQLIDVARKQRTEYESGGPEIVIDDDTIDAQCLLFLMAGYESTAVLLSFGNYMLATKPDLQERLREHIVNTTEGKEITFELLNELTYLEAFLMETLRMYPAVPSFERVATSPFTMPGTSVVLSPGDVVSVPLYAIQMDPKYYPEPEEFRPERFMGPNKKKLADVYLPFGVGPRKCIGERFSLTVAKLAMVAMMKNFKFSVCPRTEIPVTFDKASYMLKPASGLWVHVEKLN